MACLSSSNPEAASYFVKLLLMASMAAFLTFSGVKKSGSPMLRFVISIPCLLNSFTLVLMPIVKEGVT